MQKLVTDNLELDTTRKIQNKSLEMLSELSALLKKNDIDFYLACGTALGCARHSGFIPWDDDIDIYIKGRDYSKLQKVFDNQNTHNLSLHDYRIKGYPYSFPKVVATDTLLVESSLAHLDYKSGVYIDIFLLMETSNIPMVRKLYELKRYFYYGIIRAYYGNFETIKRRLIAIYVRRFFDVNKIQKKLYSLYEKEYLEAKVLIDTGVFKNQAVLRSIWFKDDIMMSFEEYTFPMPIMYKDYLRHYYGNYMQLPPISERFSSHNFAKLDFY